jgi:hypothetical protein
MKLGAASPTLSGIHKAAGKILVRAAATRPRAAQAAAATARKPGGSAGSGADRPVAARSATPVHPWVGQPRPRHRQHDRTERRVQRVIAMAVALPSRRGHAGGGRGSALVAFTGSNGFPGASEQVDAIRDCASSQLVAPWRH